MHQNRMRLVRKLSHLFDLMHYIWRHDTCTQHMKYERIFRIAFSFKFLSWHMKWGNDVRQSHHDRHHHNHHRRVYRIHKNINSEYDTQEYIRIKKKFNQIWVSLGSHDIHRMAVKSFSLNDDIPLTHSQPNPNRFFIFHFSFLFSKHLIKCNLY